MRLEGRTTGTLGDSPAMEGGEVRVLVTDGYGGLPNIDQYVVLYPADADPVAEYFVNVDAVSSRCQDIARRNQRPMISRSHSLALWEVGWRTGDPVNQAVNDGCMASGKDPLSALQSLCAKLEPKEQAVEEMTTKECLREAHERQPANVEYPPVICIGEPKGDRSFIAGWVVAGCTWLTPPGTGEGRSAVEAVRNLVRKLRQEARNDRP